MKQAYDPSQPIESLFDQYKDTMEITATANAAYSPQQIVAYTYNTIFQTGLFTNTCRTWRRRMAADKTWPNFKADFALAHQEIRESQSTAQGAGFQSANSVLENKLQQQTFEALANLATATKSSGSVISNLTDTNSLLTLQLTQTNAKLVESARADIAALLSKVALLCTGNSNGNQQCNNQTHNNNCQHGPPIQNHCNTNYCWTHVYHIPGEHTGATCQAPATGHK
jgi:hypothetical protein